MGPKVRLSKNWTSRLSTPRFPDTRTPKFLILKITMKIIAKHQSIGLFVLCAMLFTACDGLDDKFEDLNVNPTQAPEIDPNFKLTNIQLNISGERYENWRTNLIYSSTMMQHYATTAGFWEGDKYTNNNQSYTQAMWDRYYPNISKNIEDLLIQTAEDPDGGNMNAITRIVRVLMYHRLTDLYGDIPYSEAGKGFIEGIIQPKYDTQEFIYNDMLTQLEQAAAALTPGAKTFGGGDLMYGGDVDQWRKFAYSLMLRLGMRLVKVDPASAQSWVEKAIAGGVMTSNDDIAFVPHDLAAKRNGNGEVFITDSSMRLSQFFVDWMVSKGDPRLFVYGQVPVAGSPVVGLPNGLDSQTREADPTWIACADDGSVEPCGMDVYMQPNEVITGMDDPMFFMTYAEVEFLLAEAAVRGWYTGEDPATLYENGVRAAMEYLAMYGAAAQIASADIDAYLAANPYDVANALEQINEQIWAAVHLNEYEAYANWRRTGFPALTPVNYPGNVTGGTIPRRMKYNSGEAVSNAEAYTAAVSTQGPDEFTTRVWWDVP